MSKEDKKMKSRTIREIHDKEIGHKKFATFVDKVVEDGHTVSNIKEYNEKFKFDLDGYPMEFDKNPIVSRWWQLDQCYKLLEYYKILEKKNTL